MTFVLPEKKISDRYFYRVQRPSWGLNKCLRNLVQDMGKKDQISKVG